MTKEREREKTDHRNRPKMGNFSRKLELSTKITQVEFLELKNTGMEMKNVTYHSNRLDTAEEDKVASS